MAGAARPGNPSCWTGWEGEQTRKHTIREEPGTLKNIPRKHRKRGLLLLKSVLHGDAMKESVALRGESCHPPKAAPRPAGPAPPPSLCPGCRRPRRGSAGPGRTCSAAAAAPAAPIARRRRGRCPRRHRPLPARPGQRGRGRRAAWLGREKKKAAVPGH